MKDVFSFVGGALIGAAIGAGVVMFSTPRSGEETRGTIKERWTNALETGKRVAHEREQLLWADFNTRVKAPASMPLNETPEVSV